jgi:hypothetical protein
MILILEITFNMGIRELMGYVIELENKFLT